MSNASTCLTCSHCDGHAEIAVADYVTEPCPACIAGTRRCEACEAAPAVTTDAHGTFVCAECDEPEQFDLATLEVDTIIAYGGGLALKLAPLAVAMPERRFTMVWAS